ncbi:hypothetical protein LNAOJCKE_0745 [Methylorubrum aminovorans]|uniref:Lipoprotein n=1 Tax=Methylorubrum aminovorans TaxID=269069 RepID=A0ABQ4UAR1_9HYPH|nr:hypothetical protein [Methylorubrum aminovorans]GJE63548.1 hypothetical protein LNAOJCKE_0745 [Methylorubrum aminovorans]GMA79652.1 hypothetical protein GCM10025880_60690 [Methylorubrum aminovorans]
MPSLKPVICASLLALTLAACSTAPAAPALDPVPPPAPRPDAKTQLEYGNPPPIGRGGY